jgi:hypothetical protein
MGWSASNNVEIQAQWRNRVSALGRSGQSMADFFIGQSVRGEFASSMETLVPHQRSQDWPGRHPHQ